MVEPNVLGATDTPVVGTMVDISGNCLNHSQVKKMKRGLKLLLSGLASLSTVGSSFRVVLQVLLSNPKGK